MSISIKFHQKFVFAILFCIFAIAFILSPYWAISPLILERYLFLVMSAGLGLLWAYWSSNGLEIRSGKINSVSFVLLFVVLGLLNYKPLFSVIPWKGDEDYHIGVTLGLWSVMRLSGILVALLFMAFLYEGWRKSRWLLSSAIFLVLFLVPIASYMNVDYFALLRYPYISKWLGIVLLYIVRPFFGLFAEASFRLIPFISAIGLVWLCQYKLTDHNNIGLLFGIAVGTLPLIFYYSSLLYLEMPAVVLMTVVSFSIKDLLRENLRELTKHPGWYALILIGFIKETTVPFLFSFILLRFIIRFWPFSKTNIHLLDLFDEIKIIFCTAFPLMLYLFYRGYFGASRKFSPDFLNLAHLEVYRILLRGFWDQFGIFVFLFIGGCIVLAFKKQYPILFFLILAFVTDALFHIVDDIRFIGYSRFNLFLVPLIIIGVYHLLTSLSEKNTKLTGFIISGAIIINIFLLPVNSDGTKKPLWGNYTIDVSDHYYPYSEAILWLRENHPSSQIRFTGMYYPYAFEFYFQKFNWHPSYDIRYVEQYGREAENLAKSLSEANNDGIELVSYHVLGNIIPEIEDKHGFVQEKVFRNEAHTLVLYSVEEK